MKLIALGHGKSRNGNWDPGAQGNGTTEADWLRGDFLDSLKKYADSTIDFYEGNMFGNRDASTIKSYDEVIELHLDAASSTVRGGHIIIYTGYKPDALDKRLGDTIHKHFGTRGRMFDNRSNLHNLNTFARRNISYRLLELGFITNKENMDHFKANYDTIARELIADILNKKVDPKETLIKSEVITEAIKQVSKGGSDMLKVGSRGNDVTKLQNRLNKLGFSVGTADGVFGPKTKEGVKSFQESKGLSQDGIVGPNTLSALDKAEDKPVSKLNELVGSFEDNGRKYEVRRVK